MSKPAGVPRADGWYWVKPRGSDEWMAVWRRGVRLFLNGFREEWVVGKDVHECTIIVDEIGPRIPSPDERTPDTAPAPERDVPCKTPGCNYAMVPLEQDGWYVCTKCRAVHQVAAKQPAPPVSAQELREIVSDIDSNLHHHNVCGKCLSIEGALDKLRKLADWLPAPPDL